MKSLIRFPVRFDLFGRRYSILSLIGVEAAATPLAGT
jgi:hypothetical protein